MKIFVISVFLDYVIGVSSTISIAETLIKKDKIKENRDRDDYSIVEFDLNEDLSGM